LGTSSLQIQNSSPDDFTTGKHSSINGALTVFTMIGKCHASRSHPEYNEYNIGAREEAAIIQNAVFMQYLPVPTTKAMFIILHNVKRCIIVGQT